MDFFGGENTAIKKSRNLVNWYHKNETKLENKQKYLKKIERKLGEMFVWCYEMRILLITLKIISISFIISFLNLGGGVGDRPVRTLVLKAAS